MRQLIYSVAMSLDGYIAGPEGEYDWIPVDDSIDWDAFMSRFDTVLMGRRTYETAVSQEQSTVMPGLQVYVFSSTLEKPDYENVHLVKENTVGRVRELKSSSGKNIWLMGGGVLFRSLLDADLVDAVEVAVVPVLLGGGIPLLPAGEDKKRLKLKENKSYPDGMILLNYDVLKST